MSGSSTGNHAAGAYSKVDWTDLTGWPHDNHLHAFHAFLPSAQRMMQKPYRQGSGPVQQKALLRCAALATNRRITDDISARRFFEDNFEPHLIGQAQSPGFVTGFYEPQVQASRQMSSEFPVPLYRRPPDLIDIDDTNRPPDMDDSFRFGREVNRRISAYLDRSEINAGALQDRGLELAWVADKTTAFFIHVQGSARLQLDDGSLMRITYAAKSGHPYTSLAKTLCSQTGIEPELMTSDRLAEWMRAHPDEIDDLLAHNRSYIFFREVEGLDPDLGPVAAAKISLVAGRSLAVDRLIHTFGTPFWVTTSKPLPQASEPFARLMIAHDTGSAIVGAARGDLFIGSGEKAALIAGRIRHDAAMTVLVPKS